MGIQQKAIVPACRGRDIIAQAQAGTGKTATYAISALHRIDERDENIQAIILAPTRDLAEQIKVTVSALGDYMKINCLAAIGGTNRNEMSRALRRKGIHVIVGTPGRVLDLIGRRDLDTSHVKFLILDEADEMLSAGFQDAMYEIFREVPSDAQVGLYSATMPVEALEVSEKFMRDPVKVLVKEEQLTLDGIQQYYVELDEAYKLDTLCDLYDIVSVAQSVIFVNTRRNVEWLTRQMQERDFTVSCMHSDMSQEERNVVMAEFRSGSSRVLIATDILARGIDVQQVSLVINYDLPVKRDVYIHRIGRSGRFGRKGTAINFVGTRGNDARVLSDIAKHFNAQIDELPSNVGEVMQGNAA